MSILEFYNMILHPFLVTGLVPMTMAVGFCGACLGIGDKESSYKSRLKDTRDMVLLSWGVVLAILVLCYVSAYVQGTSDIETLRIYVDELERARI